MADERTQEEIQAENEELKKQIAERENAELKKKLKTMDDNPQTEVIESSKETQDLNPFKKIEDDAIALLDEQDKARK